MCLEWVFMCVLVLLNNKEPVDKGPDQQPPEPVTKPCAENNADVPSSKANSSTEEPAEAKKNKRERKAERQKNRKKEKKELRLENHQENAKSQKPKKRKAAQEAEQEAADGSSGTKSQRKKSKAQRAQDGAVDGGAEVGEQADAGPGKRKRKHSEGLWLAHLCSKGLLKNVWAVSWEWIKMCQTLPFETTCGKEHKVWEQANLGLVQGRWHNLSTALEEKPPASGLGCLGAWARWWDFFLGVWPCRPLIKW